MYSRTSSDVAIAAPRKRGNYSKQPERNSRRPAMEEYKDRDNQFTDKIAKVTIELQEMKAA